MRLTCVIFHSTRLAELRSFYEGRLGLRVGTYQKGGQTIPDCSDTYVNYDLDGTLLCFEVDGDRTDTGTVILSVDDLATVRAQVQSAGIPILSSKEFFFKIKDPEGRSLIIEATSPR